MGKIHPLNLIIVFCLVLIMSSCAAKKDIIYFYNTSTDTTIAKQTTYNPILKRNEDLYQINVSRWVTFERVLEQEE